jgi:hypothetical protein
MWLLHSTPQTFLTRPFHKLIFPCSLHQQNYTEHFLYGTQWRTYGEFRQMYCLLQNTQDVPSYEFVEEMSLASSYMDASKIQIQQLGTYFFFCASFVFISRYNSLFSSVRIM